MKTSLDCLPCFVRQTLDAARMVSTDPAFHESFLREILARITEMSLDTAPAVFGRTKVAGGMAIAFRGGGHRAIRGGAGKAPDGVSLREQLGKAGCPERAQLPFHRALLNGDLPLSIGGGIGQSRLCMQVLKKAHIGEVQVSTWPQETLRACREKGIFLL